jgi:hypothetical protein
VSSPLFIFVEGVDDETFFREIFKPRLEFRYSYIKLVQYAGWPNKKVGDMLASINAMKGQYFFICDMDRCECVTQKKAIIGQKYGTVKAENAYVVVREIESWYSAGVDDVAAKRLGCSIPGTTEDMDKEQFNQSIPPRFTSRIDYMLEMLKCFSVDSAKRKNSSFRYFARKNGI